MGSFYPVLHGDPQILTAESAGERLPSSRLSAGGRSLPSPTHSSPPCQIYLDAAVSQQCRLHRPRPHVLSRQLCLHALRCCTSLLTSHANTCSAKVFLFCSLLKISLFERHGDRIFPMLIHSPKWSRQPGRGCSQEPRALSWSPTWVH